MENQFNLYEYDVFTGPSKKIEWPKFARNITLSCLYVEKLDVLNLLHN